MRPANDCYANRLRSHADDSAAEKALLGLVYQSLRLLANVTTPLARARKNRGKKFEAARADFRTLWLSPCLWRRFPMLTGGVSFWPRPKMTHFIAF